LITGAGRGAPTRRAKVIKGGSGRVMIH